MAVNLFVYGPLMLPEVIKAVAGHDFTRRGGAVSGYMQLRLKDRSQAALVPFPDAVTEGVVYLDVDAEALSRMDEFQGKAFERGEVNVQVADGEWVEAETHLFRLIRKRELSAKPWEEEEFRKKGRGKGGIQAAGGSAVKGEGRRKRGRGPDEGR
jgi:hypothetical protein